MCGEEKGRQVPSVKTRPATVSPACANATLVIPRVAHPRATRGLARSAFDARGRGLPDAGPAD